MTKDIPEIFAREHIEVTKIVAHVKQGESVDDALREAIILSATIWQDIDVVYEDACYLIRPKEMLNAATRQRSDY